jgi:hypothetical protein
MAEAERAGVKGAGEAGGAAAAMSGGNPYVAAAGAVLGGISVYFGHKKKESRARDADKAYNAKVDRWNMYAPFFDETPKVTPVRPLEDSEGAAIAGLLQGAEQAGKFSGMYEDWKKNQKSDAIVSADTTGGGGTTGPGSRPGAIPSQNLSYRSPRAQLFSGVQGQGGSRGPRGPEWDVYGS